MKVFDIIGIGLENPVEKNYKAYLDCLEKACQMIRNNISADVWPVYHSTIECFSFWLIRRSSFIFYNSMAWAVILIVRFIYINALILIHFYKLSIVTTRTWTCVIGI